MNETNQEVPFPNSYWVLPGHLLAGEYPGDGNRDAAKNNLAALLRAGIRTFVDLTDEDEINEDAKPVPAVSALVERVS